MRLFATLLAITGLITLGLIVTLVFWMISRWLGKWAVLSNSRAGGAGRPSTAVKHGKQDTSLTHVGEASR
jgi:hypothetical protein